MRVIASISKVSLTHIGFHTNNPLPEGPYRASSFFFERGEDLLMMMSHNLTTFANVVAILVHLWWGCCAHHDHTAADHSRHRQSIEAHRHVHAGHVHADHSHAHHDGDGTNTAEHEAPLDLCEHGSCDYFHSDTVQAPVPELSPFSQLTEIPLVTHAQVEVSAALLRPSRFCAATGARLHQPLQVWLI
ncbi:MAG: hypothetical protein CMJ46_05220 [Planctomyces sp.]|nr:hypothetical protein [Planctomyces sp.]